MKKAISFIKGAREELKKISWPSKDEISRFTVVTIVMTFVIATFLWGVDMLLTKIIQFAMR